MSMYYEIFEKEERSIKILYSPVINTAKKHFVFNIVLRFDEAQKDRLKALRKSENIDISFENKLEQNMMDVIANSENKDFYFEKYYFRGANIEADLFKAIDKFNKVLHNEKICIFVHTTRAALQEGSGRKLRKELPFSKEDSPIIFNYLDEKKDKRIAYVHLIGIKS